MTQELASRLENFDNKRIFSGLNISEIIVLKIANLKIKIRMNCIYMDYQIPGEYGVVK